MILLIRQCLKCMKIFDKFPKTDPADVYMMPGDIYCPHCNEKIYIAENHEGDEEKHYISLEYLW